MTGKIEKMFKNLRNKLIKINSKKSNKSSLNSNVNKTQLSVELL